MKKIFRLRKNGRFYEPYYGEKNAALKNDNSLLPEGYEYEMEQYTLLYLLWLTLRDHGIIPRDLINENKITTHGDFVIGEIIRDQILICLLPEFKQNECLTIGIEILKNIWIKYLDLNCKDADEIVLEREGNDFSIRGIWFDKK